MKWIRGWIATIGILFNKDLLNDLKAAQEEYERGETIPWKC